MHTSRSCYPTQDQRSVDAHDSLLSAQKPLSKNSRQRAHFCQTQNPTFMVEQIIQALKQSQKHTEREWEREKPGDWKAFGATLSGERQNSRHNRGRQQNRYTDNNPSSRQKSSHQNPSQNQPFPEQNPATSTAYLTLTLSLLSQPQPSYRASNARKCLL